MDQWLSIMNWQERFLDRTVNDVVLQEEGGESPGEDQMEQLTNAT